MEDNLIIFDSGFDSGVKSFDLFRRKNIPMRTILGSEELNIVIDTENGYNRECFYQTPYTEMLQSGTIVIEGISKTPWGKIKTMPIISTGSNHINLNEIASPNLKKDTGLNELKTKLKSFLELSENWDNYGAVPINIETLLNVDNIINQIPQKFLELAEDICPNPNGTITIEWENNKGEEMSIETGINTLSYFTKLNNQALITGENISIYDNSEMSKIVILLYKLFDEPNN